MQLYFSSVTVSSSVVLPDPHQMNSFLPHMIRERSGTRTNDILIISIREQNFE